MRVNRLPSGVVDDLNASLAKLGEQLRWCAGRLRQQASCVVFKQPLSRLLRALLVGANHTRGPTLNPAGGVKPRDWFA